MESAKTNEGELTSTMGNILSTTNDEKNETSDATPTSSTDAFTTTSTSQNVADDPISSTSSDVLDSRKNTDDAGDATQSSTSNAESLNPIVESLKSTKDEDTPSPIVSEKDLLDMNITDTSTEKITENVEDIVQDLENLLGEPTTSFDFTTKLNKEVKRDVRGVSQCKDISAQLDEFSAELQMLQGDSVPSKKEVFSEEKSGSFNETTEVISNSDISANNVAKEPNVEGFSTNTADKSGSSSCKGEVSLLNIQERQEISQHGNETLRYTDDAEIKTTDTERTDQLEVTSANTEPTSERSEVTEITEITSSHTKVDNNQPLISKNVGDCILVQEEQNDGNLEQEQQEVRDKYEHSLTETESSKDKENLEELQENQQMKEEHSVEIEVADVIESSKHSENVQPVQEEQQEKDEHSVEIVPSERNENLEVGLDENKIVGSENDQKEEIKQLECSAVEEIKQQQLESSLEEEKDNQSSVTPESVFIPEAIKIQEDISSMEAMTGNETDDNIAQPSLDFRKHVEENIVELMHVDQPNEEIGVELKIEGCASDVLVHVENDISDTAKEPAINKETQEQVEQTELNRKEMMDVNDSEVQKCQVTVLEVQNTGLVENAQVTVTEIQNTESVENQQIAVLEVQINKGVEIRDTPVNEQEIMDGVEDVAVVTETEEPSEEEINDKVTDVEVGTENKPLPVTERVDQKQIITNVKETLQSVEKIIDKCASKENIEETTNVGSEDRSLPISEGVVQEQIQEQIVSNVGENLQNRNLIIDKCAADGNIEEGATVGIEDRPLPISEGVVQEQIQEQIVSNVGENLPSETLVIDKCAADGIEEGATVNTENEPQLLSEQSSKDLSLTNDENLHNENIVDKPIEVSVVDADASESVESLVNKLIDESVPTGDASGSVGIPQVSEPLEDENFVNKLIDEAVAVDTSESVEILSGAVIGNSDMVKDDVIAESVAPLNNFISDAIEMPSRTLADDLDLLVQDAVNAEQISPTSSTFEEKLNESGVEVPTSSIDTLQNLEEDVIENTMLPLAINDVPDFELNAISTLDDSKGNLTPGEQQNNENNDALLISSTLEQPLEGDIPFEENVDGTLPTVDVIFAEPNQPQLELQDENLETLLAVASLQNDSYSIPPVEDLVPAVGQIPDLISEEAVAPNQNFSTLTSAEQHLDEQDKGHIEALSVEAQQSSLNAKLKCEKGTEEVTHKEDKLKEPLVINVEDADKDKVYSPKITIKPIKSSEEVEEPVTSGIGVLDEKENTKGSLKMTITKQSDNTHSILKIYSPEGDSQDYENQAQHELTVPKLIIKPIIQHNDQPQSPKTSTRSTKQVFSPSSGVQRSASPRITIKPILKPENEPLTPLKITIKPVLKPDDSHRQKHSPKLTIKPIVKPEEECSSEPKVHSPRVTIKPIVKPVEEIEQLASPRITIKPIVKSDSVSDSSPTTPRVTIKPVVKPQEKEKLELAEQTEKSSPKITIKPIVKPQEVETSEENEESVKERIVLKINKGTIPGSSKDTRKRDTLQEEEKSEKLAKIKLKFSKEGGHPHIVQDQSSMKRAADQSDQDKTKRQKLDTGMLPSVTLTPIVPPQHSKLKEMLSRSTLSSTNVVTIDDDDDDVTIVEETASKPSPIVISEESNQDSNNVTTEIRDPISDIPVFEITPDCVKTLNPLPVEAPITLPAPRKRGRPRKVPLQVREDFKDPKEEEPKPVVVESTRPKRSCRGQSVRTTLGIKPRKPRGPGRGRGGKRGMGTRSTPTPPVTPPATPPRAAKEPKLTGAKLKQLKEDLLLLSDKPQDKSIEIVDDGLRKSPPPSLLAPPQSDSSTTDRADIVMYEEETRMSAETSSRAQTPAKQVVTSIPSVDLVEESQSSVHSVQSTATTESVKVRRGPRLEVHQEPEGAVISADQLAEYYWSGGGPYMLQEQVAQFLGIKSFKRKYPNIHRRVVDMQERDFIRESGLAGEAMCDLGLTAVNSADILDIMYSDFQDKYEEYCKHQRDRQAKDLTNKQKALSLAASQEKTKMDITQQAVQSAASWNANFNKTRKDQRKACMDLQTLTVHFPKGKMKQINKPKIGYYPVALVPGQFTDNYKEFTPTEINNLPLNTLCYDSIIKGRHLEMDCDSQTDASGSESDTSSSDSGSSYSGSSDAEDCSLCKPTPKKLTAVL